MALLIDRFIEGYTGMVASIQQKRVVAGGKPDPLLASGAQAILSACRLGQKILFTEGTMRMLAEEVRHPKETLARVQATYGPRVLTNREQLVERVFSFRGGWLEFPRPIDGVSALLAFVPGVYIPTGRDDLQVHLIGPEATTAEVIEAIMSGHPRFDPIYHQCPVGCCTRTRDFPPVLIPCERCSQYLQIWDLIFGIATLIAGQYLAESRYEEVERRGMLHSPRQHSNRARRTPTSYTFKVIDANERITPFVPPEAATPPSSTRTAGSGSWLADGEVVYEEIRTRPFVRHYRHSRYVNMKGKTTAFPEGIVRQQPHKKERLGRTITKVKASHYEQEEPSSSTDNGEA